MHEPRPARLPMPPRHTQNLARLLVVVIRRRLEAGKTARTASVNERGGQSMCLPLFQNWMISTDAARRRFVAIMEHRHAFRKVAQDCSVSRCIQRGCVSRRTALPGQGF